MCRRVNGKVFTGGIQKEKAEVGAYNFKFNSKLFVEGSREEDVFATRRMLISVLKHLRCVDASLRRSFIAAEPLDGRSYSRSTCRKFGTAVRGSSTAIPHSPVSRQVTEWLLVHFLCSVKTFLSAPIVCVGISGRNKLQLIDGAELHQEIVDAVRGYALEVFNSCPEEVVVKIRDYPRLRHDLMTVHLLKTFAY